MFAKSTQAAPLTRGLQWASFLMVPGERSNTRTFWSKSFCEQKI